TALAAARRLAAPLLPRLAPGYAVVSAGTGIAAPHAAEQEFLAWLRDGGPVQGAVATTGDHIGHIVEAAFPASLALAALLVQAGRAPQALVSGFGMWRGEALALVEPIPESEA
ncbi:MAG: hypothetical protein K2X49_10030, partial [Acetobacteraceae bacterium]|nr:hypothetical protein [Acetobacteraceae bacterium]